MQISARPNVFFHGCHVGLIRKYKTIASFVEFKYFSLN